ALAASYMCPVRLVGIVGDDFPQASLQHLERHRIDLSGLEVVPGGKTFRWKGRYHDNMNERDTLDTQLGVFEGFDPVLPQRYTEGDYLFLANIQPEVQLRVLEQMRSPKLVGLDTMNLWIDIARPQLEKVISKVDILMINEEEARQLTGEHN